MGPDQEATESDVVSDVTDSTDVINANDVADAADGTDTESAEGVDAESTESAEDAETQKSERPTRHAMIMRGVVTPIFGLLAVAAIVLGVLNATIWKPSSEITASANVTGSRYVVTDPGVLTLLDKNTTMTVKSSSSKDETCVALASTKDAAGWVASEKSYQRISGLTSWTELGVQKGEPKILPHRPWPSWNSVHIRRPPLSACTGCVLKFPISPCRSTCPAVCWR